MFRPGRRAPISQYALSEQQLAPTSLRLEAFEHSTVPHVVMDIRGNLSVTNNAFLRFTGYSGATHPNVFDLFAPDSQEEFRELLRRMLISKLPTGSRGLELIKKDGSRCVVELGISPVFEGEPQFIISFIDITALRRRNMLLEREHEILRLLAAGTDTDKILDRTILLLQEMLPETRSLILAREENELILAAVGGVSPEHGDEIFHYLSRVGLLQQTEPFFVEGPEADTVSGGRLFYRIHSSSTEFLGAILLLNEQEDFIGEEEQGYLRRISQLLSVALEQRRNSRQLSRQRQVLRAVIDLSPNIIFVKDRSGRYILANRAFGDFYGVTPESIVGKQVSDLNARPEEIAGFDREDQMVFEDGIDVWTPERQVTDATGRKRILRVMKRPLQNEDGLIDRLVGIAMDITEIKEREEERVNTEKQVQQSRHLERLGTLAGGVAHDFNNLLQVITGHTSLALLTTSDLQSTAEHLGEIRGAAVKASELVSQLLAYSGQGRTERRQLKLSDVAAECIRVIQRVIPTNVSLLQALSPEPGWCEGDYSQIRQLLMNLLVNAGDALEGEGGVVKVQTGECMLSEEQLRALVVPAENEPGPYIFLEVSDTGAGISPDQFQRIFEPFFTTKFFGRGMGLSAVLGIARNHHAGIDISSSPGSGASFRVYFRRVYPTG